MSWTAETVSGKAVDVYRPAGVAKPRFGVLFLHGTGGETLRERPAFTGLFDELNLPCASPMAGPCWWVDRLVPEFDARITPEQFLRESMLEFFRERFGLLPRSLGLLGISMGGQGALRLAFKYP